MGEGYLTECPAVCSEFSPVISWWRATSVHFTVQLAGIYSVCQKWERLSEMRLWSPHFCVVSAWKHAFYVVRYLGRYICKKNLDSPLTLLVVPMLWLRICGSVWERRYQASKCVYQQCKWEINYAYKTSSHRHICLFEMAIEWKFFCILYISVMQQIRDTWSLFWPSPSIV